MNAHAKKALLEAAAALAEAMRCLVEEGAPLPPPEPKNEPVLISVSEAARMLNYSVSTVYRALRRGDLKGKNILGLGTRGMRVYRASVEEKRKVDIS